MRDLPSSPLLPRRTEANVTSSRHCSIYRRQQILVLPIHFESPGAPIRVFGLFASLPLKPSQIFPLGQSFPFHGRLKRIKRAVRQIQCRNIKSDYSEFIFMRCAPGRRIWAFVTAAVRIHNFYAAFGHIISRGSFWKRFDGWRDADDAPMYIILRHRMFVVHKNSKGFNVFTLGFP